MSGEIYYAPEEFGLTVVGEIDNGGGYDFDLFVVWRDAAGTLYWGADSGCSCPSPFEDTYALDQLDTGDPQQAHDSLDAWVGEQYGHYPEDQVAQLHAALADL